MVVRTQRKCHGMTGLNIGVNNVQRYFPPSMVRIELRLDHLAIACDLAPEFWHGQPEIYDPRLCAWLESKHCCSPAGVTQIALDLQPEGHNSFRLAPKREKAISEPRLTPTAA